MFWRQQNIRRPHCSLILLYVSSRHRCNHYCMLCWNMGHYTGNYLGHYAGYYFHPKKGQHLNHCICHGAPVFDLFVPIRLLRPPVLTTVAPILFHHHPFSAVPPVVYPLSDVVRRRLMMCLECRRWRHTVPVMMSPDHSDTIKGRVHIADLFFWPSPSSQKCHNWLPVPDRDKLPGPIRVPLMVSTLAKAVPYLSL